MNKRLITALVAYAVLMVAAFLVLNGTPLLVVLIVLGLFLVKTLIFHFAPK